MNTYRISRSFQIGLHEFREGEIIKPLDFLGKLHNIDVAPYWVYFEPVDSYFARKYLPVIHRIDSLRESDFQHTGAAPIKRLNKAMLDLLEAQKTENILAFNLGLQIIEGILNEVEAAKKAGDGKKAAAGAKKIKKAVQNRKTKKDLKDALSGRL